MTRTERWEFDCDVLTLSNYNRIRIIDQRRAGVSAFNSNVPCKEFCLSVGRSAVASVFYLGADVLFWGDTEILPC